MLPSSIMTFWSLTQQPSTPLSVLVARATAWLMASSKLCSETALSSVTLATLIRLCLPKSIAHCLSDDTPQHLLRQIPGGALLVSSLLHAPLGLVYGSLGLSRVLFLGILTPRRC